MADEEYLVKGVDIQRMEAERIRRANSRMLKLERRIMSLEETVVALQETVNTLINPKKAKAKNGK